MSVDLENFCVLSMTSLKRLLSLLQILLQYLKNIYNLFLENSINGQHEIIIIDYDNKLYYSNLLNVICKSRGFRFSNSSVVKSISYIFTICLLFNIFCVHFTIIFDKTSYSINVEQAFIDFNLCLSTALIGVRLSSTSVQTLD